MRINARDLYTRSSHRYHKDWSTEEKPILLEISGILVYHDTTIQPNINEKIQSKLIKIDDLFTRSNYLRLSGITPTELKKAINSKELKIVKIHGRKFIRDKELSQKLERAKNKY